MWLLSPCGGGLGEGGNNSWIQLYLCTDNGGCFYSKCGNKSYGFTNPIGTIINSRVPTSRMVIQRHWIFFLMCFYFLCVLLFWRLWQRELGEFVSVMEHNPSCSMKTFHELCESWFCKEIGRKISGEQRDEVMRNIFDASWGRKNKLFSDEKS